MTTELLESKIRDIPDFPKKGILFKDITPLLQHGPAFKAAVQLMAESFQDQKIDAIVGVESRGFIFGSAVACELGLGFVPVRKIGKLPYQTESVACTLEYGEAILQIHKDALESGQKVALLDDLLATGGTARASIDLIEKIGAEVDHVGFLIELDFLKGRDKFNGYRVNSLLHY